MTHSTVWSDGVGIAQTVPMAGVSLFAGSRIGRADRRRVYLTGTVGSAVCSLLLAVQGFAGHAPGRPARPGTDPTPGQRILSDTGCARLPCGALDRALPGPCAWPWLLLGDRLCLAAVRGLDLARLPALPGCRV